MSLRDYMHNPVWRQVYQNGMFQQHIVNGNYVDPQRKDARFTPISTYADGNYSVIMSRFGQGSATYDTSVNSPVCNDFNRSNLHRAIETCSDSTGNPHVCADAYLDIPQSCVSSRVQMKSL